MKIFLHKVFKFLARENFIHWAIFIILAVKRLEIRTGLTTCSESNIEKERIVYTATTEPLRRRVILQFVTYYPFLICEKKKGYD